MDRQKKNFSILLIIGLLLTAIIQVVNYYLVLPDFLHGVVTGMGIGTLMMALIFRKIKPKGA